MKKVCGVYRIRNVITGKSYVGSSINAHRRWCWHRSALNGHRHHAPFLQASWIKHGESAFEFTILHECAPEALVENEQRWIDDLKAFGCATGYNATPKAGSTAARQMSDATKAKLRAASLGRRASAETRAKMTLARTGKPKFQPPASAETRARMSAARRGHDSMVAARAACPVNKPGHTKPLAQRAKISATLRGVALVP